MLGIILILVSILVLVFAAGWGISYTREHLHEDPFKRYRAAGFLFTIGFILSASYLLAAKKFTQYIDLTIAWMLLSAGLLIVSSFIFIFVYLRSHQDSSDNES